MKKLSLNQMESIIGGGEWWDCMTRGVGTLTSDLWGTIALTLYPGQILAGMSIICIVKPHHS